MEAGFDTTVVTIPIWKELCSKFKINNVPIRSAKGWIWYGEKGSIFTSHNPYTGYHFSQVFVNPSELGMLGYVGIDGESGFVADLFVYLRDNAEYVKMEEFGARSYI